MDQKKYTKLKDLVGSSFTVEKVWGYKWKMWLPAENRMHVAEKWEKDHQKKWGVETDRGELDVSDYQFGAMLSSVFKDGSSTLNGQTFEVKSNGKEGKEIRYFINASRAQREEPKHNGPELAQAARAQRENALDDIDDNPVDLSEIPF